MSTPTPAAHERGTAMMEFALVVPFLTLMLAGTIDVGRYTYYGILAAHAASSGVQYGAQNLLTAADAAANGPATRAAAFQDAESISQFTVTASVFCTLNGQSSPCPVSNSGAAPPSGLVYFVKVQVNGTFSPLIQYPGIRSVPIGATTTMRVIDQ